MLSRPQDIHLSVSLLWRLWDQPYAGCLLALYPRCCWGLNIIWQRDSYHKSYTRLRAQRMQTHTQIQIIPCTVWQNEYSASAITNVSIYFFQFVNLRQTHTHPKSRNDGYSTSVTTKAFDSFPKFVTHQIFLLRHNPLFFLIHVSASIITDDPQTIIYVFRQYYCDLYNDNKDKAQQK